MSTSAADTSAPQPSGPLASLFEKIEEARQLPELKPYRRTWDDPIEKVRERMHAHLEGEEPGTERGGRAPETTLAPSGRAEAESAASLVGHQVLRLLEDRPLAGPARAEAVQRLAAQLDQPDRQALREILGLLITGQND